ncbi:MAG: tetratricopeptide repeat protein [Gemmataceae bacterium]|nr:hypothetical protein [Gemmata sp.]MDW8197032.1 tetratricopeptide repeat protein [Gemmataceae bacterium]
MVRAIVVAVSIVVGVIVSDGHAALYHPDDRTDRVFVDEKGQPEPYPFDEFKRRRLVLRNIGNPAWPLWETNPQTQQIVRDPKTGQPVLSDRGKVDARVKQALQKPAAARTLEEKVALAVDLLRLNRPEEAQGILGSERSGYWANVTLAHLAIAQGQWAKAWDYLDIANEEPVPSPLPGISAAQLAWYGKLNRGSLMKLIQLRLHEEKGPKRPPEEELPDDLFGIRFVNDAGHYEPGQLAAAEKAKLPGGHFTEALATVQQLVLWFPFDTRLYWLLGELYAAQGDFQTALDIMNECVDSGRYSNRKALMEHREAVARLANMAPPVADEPELPVSMRTVALYFGAVAVIAVVALVRSLWKRIRGGSNTNCRPIG